MPSPAGSEQRKRHGREAKRRLTDKGVATKSGNGSRPRWTDAEIALITTETIDVVALSKKLDRTVDAIYMKRSKVLRTKESSA